MATWKVFVIQFLNIAGLGPIFGAIMGAAYGPASYLWIVLGCIFMGAVHDFFAGMMSLRNGGANMPGITGKYLGHGMKVVAKADVEAGNIADNQARLALMLGVTIDHACAPQEDARRRDNGRLHHPSRPVDNA